tara:strand:- start:1191 stop:1349 length:159 start_codon:yes stop_codon:yes gene_type:complete
MVDIIDSIRQVHFDIVKKVQEDNKQACKRRKKATKMKHKWRNTKVRTGKGKL